MSGKIAWTWLCFRLMEKADSTANPDDERACLSRQHDEHAITAHCDTILLHILRRRNFTRQSTSEAAFSINNRKQPHLDD